jgi:hypothetical protein
MCDFDFWSSDLVYDTASYIGEHYFEISFKFLNAWKRYAPDKIMDKPARQPEGKLYHDPFFKRAYTNMI